MKTTLAEQQASSARLRGVTEALELVANQVNRIPTALSGIVAKAENVEQRIRAAAEKIDALKNEVPEIVARIENSDVGRSIDALSKDISQSRQELRSFGETASSLNDLVQQFRQAMDAVSNAVASEYQRNNEAREKTNESIDALRSELRDSMSTLERGISTSEEASEKNVIATGKAFDLIATTLRGAADRQATAMQGIQSEFDAIKSQELASIRQELKTLTALVQQQGVSLEAVAKKKGFSF